jgi:hypothetical protein
MSTESEGLSADELAAEGVTALPDKEVVSVLDLNADLDLAIDAAAPIDLAVAANANVAAPIDAAVGANILSEGSSAQALSDQGVMINQDVTADATAESVQDSTIEQGDAAAPADAGIDDATGGTAPAPASLDGSTVDAGPTTDGVTGAVDGATDGVGGVTDGVGGVTEGVGSIADGNLLNVNVDLAADADIAAPINGAVAANANIAAPIDAAVSANILSEGSDATAIAQQDAIITQTITGTADATSDQVSNIDQGSLEPVDTDTASADDSASGTTATAAASDATAAPAEEPTDPPATADATTVPVPADETVAAPGAATQ